MFGKTALFTTLALAGSVLAQTFSVATPPSLIQCQPAQITWTGGSAPFIIAVIPGGQTTAAAVATLSDSQSASPFVWSPVNLASGSYITIKITDASGVNAYSAPLTIQQGSSSTCLNTSASTGALSTMAVSSTVSNSASSASASSAISSLAASSSAAASSVMSSSSSMMSSASSSAAVSASSSASRSSSAAGNAVSSVSSVAGAGASAASSATSRAGAYATAVAGIPAIAAGAFGVAALLF